MSAQIETLLELLVGSGLHQGARIALPLEGNGIVGSSAGASVLIVDPQIAAECVHLACDAGAATFTLTVLAEGVRLFGYKVAVGASFKLLGGSYFSLAATEFTVCAHAPLGGDNRKFFDRSQRKARRHFLRQFSRREYLFSAVKEFCLGNYVYAVYLVLAVSMVLIVKAVLVQGIDDEAREHYAQKISALFKDVISQDDYYGGSTQYSGYVGSQRDLRQLGDIAMTRDSGHSIINVIPMDIMAFNVDAFLRHYYDDFRVEVEHAGALRVELTGPSSIKVLGGWDFKNIERQAKDTLPGLLSLQIAFPDVAFKAVRAPLAGSGLSIMSNSEGLRFVVSADNQVFFEGSSLSQGRIRRILPCAIEIEVPGEATVFQMMLEEGASHACQ